MFICSCACMYRCMCIYVIVCMCIYVIVCMYVYRLWVCMCVCLHVCIYISISTRLATWLGIVLGSPFHYMKLTKMRKQDNHKIMQDNNTHNTNMNLKKRVVSNSSDQLCMLLLSWAFLPFAQYETSSWFDDNH